MLILSSIFNIYIETKIIYLNFGKHAITIKLKKIKMLKFVRRETRRVIFYQQVFEKI